MSQYELNLRDYLRILFKRKVLIISTCLFSVFLSFFYTTHEIPTYEAKASVKIDQRKTIAGLLTEEILYSPGDVMSTAARLITGFPVLKNAALHLKLIDENTSPEKIKEAAGEIADCITTSPVPSTNVIEITATNENPKKAMDYANAVAEAYIEENLLEKNKETHYRA